MCGRSAGGAVGTLDLRGLAQHLRVCVCVCVCVCAVCVWGVGWVCSVCV